MPVSPDIVVGEVLGGLAQTQCRVIVRALAHTRDRHRAVHRARKAIRLLRAILALAGDDLDPSLRSIDRTLRTLARGLSPLRDAHVVVGVAQSLADGEHAHAWTPVADRLRDRRDAMLAELLRRDPLFARRRARVEMLAGQLAELPWARLRCKALRRAVTRSERRAIKAERVARQNPSDGHVHAWRRRLRRLRLQWQVLEKLGEDCKRVAGRMPPNLRAMHRRTDALGDRRDLRMLGRQLAHVAAPEQLPALRGRLKQALAATD